MARDEEMIGLFLQGLAARGDYYDSSDLDLYAVLKDGLHRPFRSEYRDGILVEIKYADFEKGEREVSNRPNRAVQFLDSIILFDQQGRLKQLKELAESLFNRYRTPQRQMKFIAYWLESALVKIKAALEASDELKASFVVSTTSWQVIEGIWAVNHKPVPPNGSVLYHVRDLNIVPADMERQIQLLFAGNVKERVSAAVEVIEWTLQVLNYVSNSWAAEYKPIYGGDKLF